MKPHSNLEVRTFLAFEFSPHTQTFMAAPILDFDVVTQLWKETFPTPDEASQYFTHFSCYHAHNVDEQTDGGGISSSPSSNY